MVWWREVDHVAGLLAAERRAGRQHPLEHVAVADVGHLDRDAVLAPSRGGSRGSSSRCTTTRVDAAARCGDRRDDRVAVHRPAAGVDREAAVGVAVERDARRPRPRSRTRRGDGLEMGRADAGVDVAAVRLGADAARRDAQPLETARRGRVRGAVGAVDAPARRRRRRRRRRSRPASRRSASAASASTVARRRPAPPAPRRSSASIAASAASSSLRPSPPQELDAVVLVGVVRGRDDAAELAPRRGA